MGQIVRLRKFDPPLPRFVSKRNRPVKVVLELGEDPVANVHALNRMITECMHLVNCETPAKLTPAERRRLGRQTRARLAAGLPAPGLEHIPVDQVDGAWHMHVWYPNQRPVTAA